MAKQEKVIRKAMKNVQVPEIDHFLTRKTVKKWMERMDQPNKTFYIYVLADNGSIVGYYVAQYRPISVGTYMTPTQQPYNVDVSKHGHEQLGPAPSLDGTYYGMNGGSGDQFYFFDAETDAYIELKGLNYFISDQPLALDAPRLKVESDDEEKSKKAAASGQ